ncbi:conjugative transfer TraG domain protein, partial [Orientia tsutsugamushi str. TA763]
LNAIIDQNPEISSKEQAARWAKDHSAEAEKIAFKVAQINNEVPKDLNDYINDDNFLNEQDLQEIFNKKSEELKGQNVNYSNDKAYNKNIEQTFSNNKKIKNLDRISDSIKDKTKEIQDEFNNTSNSAVILTGKQAVKNLKDNK